jgi:putative heme iron utilization protein
MEALDPECKDFETLDFELNHTTGMLLGYRHSLTLAMQNGDLNLE